MDTSEKTPQGMVEALRSLGAGLVGTVSDRLELFAVELQEEKFRLIQLFIWISATVFAGVMAVSFASLVLVYFFWESARLAVLVGLTFFYLVLFCSFLMLLRRFISRQPVPFATTRKELVDDLTCIQPKS